MNNLITLTLPCILSFDDYHEIGYLVNRLNEMKFSERAWGTPVGTRKANIRAVELSFMNNEYHAIFYVGNKNSIDYKEMVESHESEAKTAKEDNYQPSFTKKRIVRRT